METEGDVGRTQEVSRPPNHGSRQQADRLELTMSADTTTQEPPAAGVQSGHQSNGWWQFNWSPLLKFLWPRFPAKRLVADDRLQKWTPKLIWFVIPLEYYVVTSFSGGISTESYLSVVIFSVVCVFAFVITGFVVAVLLPFTGTLQSRSRGMITSLLCVWGTALLLQAASYFLTWLFSSQGTSDVLASLLHDRWHVPNPLGLDGASFLVNFGGYLGYAILAIVIDMILIGLIARPDPKLLSPPRDPSDEWIREPGVIVVSVLVALLMLILHAMTISQFTILLNGAYFT